MKTKLSLLVVVLANAFAFAQSETCAENLSLMASSVKAKDITAYDYLAPLRKDCATSNELIYRYGEFAIKLKIDKAANDSEKEKYVRELLGLFDEHFKNYPTSSYAKGVEMKKGMALFNYNVGTKEESYKHFDNAFKNDLANFDDVRGLYAYFEMFVNDYKAGNKGIELQQVFDKYDDISEKLAALGKENSDVLDGYLNRLEANETLSSKEEKNKAKIESNLENIAVITSSMDAIIVDLSSCDKLIPFYQKGFEENKTNEQWLKRAADRLESKECDTDPLFSKISEALYKLNPSAEAAYKLGVVEVQRKNTTKALEYFNQAANLFQDNTKKAQVYMRIAAMYKNSSKSQARSYARKALAVKPSYGMAHLFIAGLYGSSVNECGNDQFEKRAVYWLAAREADKAAAVDASVKAKAQSMAAQYRAAAPSKTDIFTAGRAGQRIAFNCWIGESIVVPNL